MTSAASMDGRATVLVVDDEPDIRFLARTILVNDFDLLEAGGGAEALEILRVNTDIDLVLLDIRMPDVDGFAVLDSLMARRMLDDLPVVAFSAHADQTLVDQVFRRGAMALVRKPFTFEELTGAIRDALERRGDDPRTV